MTKYKYKFNERELGLITQFTGTDKVKSLLMSLYAYIIKYPDSTSKDLFSKYMHKTAKEYRFSRQTFNRYLSLLEELGLISRVRKGLKIIISKVNNNADLSADLSTENSTKPFDTTIIGADVETQNSKHSYYNTNTSIDNNLDEIVAPVEIACKVEEVANDLNITKKKTISKIQKMIMTKVIAYNIQVKRRGLYAYLRTAILEKYKTIKFYSNLAYTVSMNAKLEAGCYYGEQYQGNGGTEITEDMESMLLGWE